MSLNDTLKNVVNNVSGALGCGVVDLQSGMLLGAHHSVPYFTQSFLDAVGAAAVDMMRGRNVNAVQKMMAAQRGVEQVSGFTEIQMTSENTYHFVAEVPGKPNALVILITSKQTNLGMGWAGLRQALPEIAPKCP
ncbi:MAG: hypothetical protein COA61_009235 [Zetaproteobacteria bacterium]|nr:hypothetical protein [Zetaproteobacteria bacterium]MDQ6953181.1 hypothetical protein [Mariprofundaceae bacterium]